MWDLLRSVAEEIGHGNDGEEVRVSMPSEMAGDSVQMQMIRRYARILREQQAQYRGPRIGARERRTSAAAARGAAGSAARRALSSMRSPESPVT